jgi:hypothetical protein
LAECLLRKRSVTPHSRTSVEPPSTSERCLDSAIPGGGPGFVGRWFCAQSYVDLPYVDLRNGPCGQGRGRSADDQRCRVSGADLPMPWDVRWPPDAYAPVCNSVNAYARPIRSLAIWLVDEGILSVNPFRRSRRRAALNPLLPSEETPTKSATLGDLQTLERGCAGQEPRDLRDRAIVSILVTTAARNSSVQLLRIGDVDFVVCPDVAAYNPKCPTTPAIAGSRGTSSSSQPLNRGRLHGPAPRRQPPPRDRQLDSLRPRRSGHHRREARISVALGPSLLRKLSRPIHGEGVHRGWSGPIAPRCGACLRASDRSAVWFLAGRP